MEIYETINCYDNLTQLRERIKELELLKLKGIRFNLSKSKGNLAGDLDNIKCAINEQDGSKEFLLDLAYPRCKPRIVETNFDNKITADSVYYIVENLDDAGEQKCIQMENFRRDSAKVGDCLYYADGLGGFEVTKCSKTYIKVKALNSFSMNVRKSISLSTKEASLDFDLLTRFLSETKNQNISFILAFVEDAKEVERFRENVAGNYKIISKIESTQGMVHLEDIADKSDGILLARGDLAMHADFSNLCAYTVKISEAAKKYGKELYCATDILLSMEDVFLPKRSEIIDVSFNIVNGCRKFILPNYMLNLERAVEVLGKIEVGVEQSGILSKE